MNLSRKASDPEAPGAERTRTISNLVVSDICVFCSLPLHATGPIRSDDPLKLYFSDLYIPNTTLSVSPYSSNLVNLALIFREATNASILLVAQPDEFTMPGGWEEISLVRRLETTVTTLVSRRATSSAAVIRLQDHRFAHFSCHGILETGKPFGPSFKLCQGKHLTLLNIIQSRLPSAEFAFLSTCHTAELTKGCIFLL